MKAAKKDVALLAALMVFFGAAISASADTVQQDGVVVTLTADKEAYDSKGNIEAELSVTNTNSWNVTNLDLESYVPNGYNLDLNSKASASVEKLLPGETVSVNVIFVPEKIEDVIPQAGTVHVPEINVTANEKVKPKINNNYEFKPVDSGSGQTSSSSADQAAASSAQSTTAAANASVDTANPDTGNSRKLVIGSALLIAGAGAVFAVSRKKKISKGLMSFMVCTALLGSSAAVISVDAAPAAKTSREVITVSESVMVGSNELTLTAKVEYDKNVDDNSKSGDESTAETESKADTESTADDSSKAGEDVPEKERPVKPENPTEADEYYFGNSEVIDVTDAASSDAAMTERNVLADIKTRGFVDQPITYDYSITGEFLDDTEADENSSVKHPMYQTLYLSKNNEVWVIYVIGNSVIANPLSYNLNSGKDVPIMFSESEVVTSYDDASNKFYLTKPYKTSMILKVVDKVDAETLDKLTVEEIDKL